MQFDALLNQFDYTPNPTLKIQLKRIINNTPGFDKIEKHIVDLHDALKVDESYVAMSNSVDLLKIKIEAPSEARKEEALEKVNRFSERYKVDLEKVDGKDTFYIKQFRK